MTDKKSVDDELLMFVEAKIVLKFPVLRKSGETYFGGEMRVREIVENWPVYKLHGINYTIQSFNANDENIWKRD